MKNVATKTTSVIVALCVIAGTAVAKDQLPDVTEDGPDAGSQSGPSESDLVEMGRIAA
jgi:hypothetical protein